MMRGTDKRQRICVVILLPYIAAGRSRGLYVVPFQSANAGQYQGVYVCPPGMEAGNPRTNSLIWKNIVPFRGTMDGCSSCTAR